MNFPGCCRSSRKLHLSNLWLQYNMTATWLHDYNMTTIQHLKAPSDVVVFCQYLSKRSYSCFLSGPLTHLNGPRTPHSRRNISKDLLWCGSMSCPSVNKAHRTLNIPLHLIAKQTISFRGQRTKTINWAALFNDASQFRNLVRIVSQTPRQQQPLGVHESLHYTFYLSKSTRTDILFCVCIGHMIHFI